MDLNVWSNNIGLIYAGRSLWGKTNGNTFLMEICVGMLKICFLCLQK